MKTTNKDLVNFGPMELKITIKKVPGRTYAISIETDRKIPKPLLRHLAKTLSLGMQVND